MKQFQYTFAPQYW